MRETLWRELEMHIKHPERTGIELGSGMYGSVVEMVLDGERVAGKVFEANTSVMTDA